MKLLALTHAHQGRHHSFHLARLTFSVAISEIEQRYVIKFLCAKKFVFDRILAELALVYGEQAYAKKAVEY
jgi:hypothetical protein